MNIKNLQHAPGRRGACAWRRSPAWSLAALGAAACGSDDVRQGQAISYLIINRLEAGRDGAEAGAPFTPVLPSDVQTSGSVFEDNGRVHDDGGDEGRHQPERADDQQPDHRDPLPGRRSAARTAATRPASTCPYAFDGAVTFTVGPGDESSVPFVAGPRPGQARIAAGQRCAALGGARASSRRSPT